MTSNMFTTFPQHEHFNKITYSLWHLAARVSWNTARSKYLRQVPDNRIGYAALCLMSAVFIIFKA
uniref:DMT family protein n=1 Tax=Candidatus Nitrotoga sp. BS TaxID=2890408 RepID=UPI0021136AA3|nr:DMT family protein [Candidatus Nitrotoga sp. BS]